LRFDAIEAAAALLITDLVEAGTLTFKVAFTFMFTSMSTSTPRRSGMAKRTTR
jgi:hypothetical protein